MKLFNKQTIAALSLVLAVSAAPSTAHAGGKVHLNLPGLTIGVGDHGYKHRKHYRKYKRHHRNHHRNHRRDHYYDDYRPRDYRYDNRRYNSRRYNDNYYYGSGRRYDRDHYNDRRYYDRRNYDRGYYRDRRSRICPVAGFSLYIDNSRNCYEHKGHYHCS